KLIELVEDSAIAELENSEGEESVRISRTPANVGYPLMQQAYAVPAPQPELAAAVAPDAATVAAAAAKPVVSGHIVR
ncbi:acetyl-CoA carboxylase biotin carboxyl carrier protein, partial [Pantoea dispersa]|nr:acetyl-CoA carboxylase biotin carboxyl carrier protein [Pantoea dispersa]